jgi:hypothetical protein
VGRAETRARREGMKRMLKRMMGGWVVKTTLELLLSLEEV